MPHDKLDQPAAPSFDIATDRLDGARAIARFVYGSDAPEHVKRVYADVVAGTIPAGKRGGRLVASKLKVRTAYLELTSGERPPPKLALQTPAPPPEPAPSPPPAIPARRGPGRPRGPRKKAARRRVTQ